MVQKFTKMKDEYIIISKKAVQKELSRLKQQRNVEPDNYTQSYINGKIKQLEWVLSQSTPLIPEIEKAFTKGENIVTGKQIGRASCRERVLRLV